MSGCQGCAFKGMSTAVEDTFVGVRIAEETNLTLCASGSRRLAVGEQVIVDFDQGPVFGHVEQSPMAVFKPCQKSSARQIVRRAKEQDKKSHDKKLLNEDNCKRFCRERAREGGLEMKVSKVDFSLNSRTATVYFTAEKRVDFRNLVRDMSERFRQR